MGYIEPLISRLSKKDGLEQESTAHPIKYGSPGMIKSLDKSKEALG